MVGEYILKHLLLMIVQIICKSVHYDALHFDALVIGCVGCLGIIQ